MHRYAIRLARPDDVALLARIERAAAALFKPYGFARQFARETLPREDLASAVARDFLWVAVDGRDRPVGFALLEELDGNAHLHEIDVHPKHGRRGLGRALLATVIKAARERGYPAITLTTFRHVPWNAPFYASMGFRVLGERELPDALRALLRAEVERGLPAKERVAMRLRLTPLRS
ncbi:MAG TPA: GNAT family N-acetyltransferase [Candidatus Binatia bacterium]